MNKIKLLVFGIAIFWMSIGAIALIIGIVDTCRLVASFDHTKSSLIHTLYGSLDLILYLITIATALMLLIRKSWARPGLQLIIFLYLFIEIKYGLSFIVSFYARQDIPEFIRMAFLAGIVFINIIAAALFIGFIVILSLPIVKQYLADEKTGGEKL